MKSQESLWAVEVAEMQREQLEDNAQELLFSGEIPSFEDLDELRAQLAERHRLLLLSAEHRIPADCTDEFNYLIRREIDFRAYCQDRRKNFWKTNVNLTAIGSASFFVKFIAAIDLFVISAIVTILTQTVRFGYNSVHGKQLRSMKDEHADVRRLLTEALQHADGDLLIFRARILELFGEDFLHELQDSSTAVKNQQSVGELDRDD